MDWSVILSSSLAGSIVGAVVSQWWSARRDRANREHQFDLQRAEWRRADRVCAADRKREAAIAVLQEVGRFVLEVRREGVERDVRNAAEIRLLACLERLQFELEPGGIAMGDAMTLHGMVRSKAATDWEVAACAEDFTKLVRREIVLTQEPEDSE